MNKRHIILFTLLLNLMIGSAVQAQPVRTDFVESQLVAEEASIQPGRSFWIALRMKMDEHWHIYWRNPGDAAYPTSIEWTLPEGFTAGPIHWPYPQQIDLPPLANYGYEGEVYLLTEITPPADLKPGTTVDITAYGDWLVCEEVCIPGSSYYTLPLPVKDEPPMAVEKWMDGFAKARGSLPLEEHGWKVEAAVTDSQVVIQATRPAWFTGELSVVKFFPYESTLINHFDTQLFTKDNTTYQVTANANILMSKTPERIQGVLVSEDGWRGPGSEKAIAFDVPVSGTMTVLTATAAAAVPTGGSDEVTNTWWALVFAFAGGIILNLMPCVLPVLSLKVLGFLQQAGEDESKSWQHGCMFTAGVLISFLVLAGILIGLRAGGEQLGWGFQLQSPAFVAIISSFLFLFGLSLFGVFEIGTSLVSAGGQYDNRSGMTGTFISGVAATVVATPCTAPFMGSALGFALTQSTTQSLLIFAFLGLGMASPYLLLSFVPSLIRFMPKPGEWMVAFKQFLGFLLMATVVWLIFVIGNQTGVLGMTMLLILLVVLGIGAWVLGRWGSIMASRQTRLIARTVGVIIIAGGLGYILSILPTASGGGMALQAKSDSGPKWEAFSAQRVNELRQTGRPVFVDFTAAWCLSCQVNERVALHNYDVVRKFQELGVVTLKADWTSRDAEITRALGEFGRNSVPLYVLYTGDANAKPVLLPEILTPGIVLNALKEVKAPTTAHVR